MFRRLHLASCLILILVLSPPGWSEGRPERLKAAISRLVGGRHVGVSIWHFKSGERVEVDGNTAYPLASVSKLPLLVELARQLQSNGKLTLATKLTLADGDRCIGGGALKSERTGTKVSVQRLVELMTTASDNTAADMLFRRVGLESVDQMLAKIACDQSQILLTQRAAWLVSLGAYHAFHEMLPADLVQSWRAMSPTERLNAARAVEAENHKLSLASFQHLEDEAGRNHTPADQVLIATNVDNMGTPNELVTVLRQLIPDAPPIPAPTGGPAEDGPLLQPRWRKFCLNALSHSLYNTRIPRGLPAGVRVYHKTGSLTGVVNDVGLVELRDHSLMAIAVLVTGQSDSKADPLIAAIAQAAYAAYK